MKEGVGPALMTCAMSTDILDADQIMVMHHSNGHPGIKRTCFFCATGVSFYTQAHCENSGKDMLNMSVDQPHMSALGERKVGG